MCHWRNAGDFMFEFILFVHNYFFLLFEIDKININKICLLMTYDSVVLLVGGVVSVALWRFAASHLAGLLRQRDPSTNPGPTAWYDV